ncbi:hypothetical protein, partial [Streptomyces sp. T21Q-yed]|uniref:hypothetical protein n=1 Tax=Streptomyces sp. T21Q-yed TaxID=3018441 RepID=UPI0023DED86E
VQRSSHFCVNCPEAWGMLFEVPNGVRYFEQKIELRRDSVNVSDGFRSGAARAARTTEQQCRCAR